MKGEQNVETTMEGELYRKERMKKKLGLRLGLSCFFKTYV